jgi:histidine ammonia-lyase
MALVGDTMKTLAASVGDLLDRQVALLMSQDSNNGLPRNLSGATGVRRVVNHGLKALQIATSAWAAEALHLTMPASSFSRSTECHNQDKVSMGTIGARHACRILELTEQILAATLIAGVQAAELRVELSGVEIPDGLRAIVADVRRIVSPVVEDRPLEGELRALTGAIRRKVLPILEFAEVV